MICLFLCFLIFKRLMEDWGGGGGVVCEALCALQEGGGEFRENG